MWYEKPWGWQKSLTVSRQYEVWQGVAKANTATSLHMHPHHRQQLVVTSGLVTVLFGARLEEQMIREKMQTFATGGSCEIPPNQYHQLRFSQDSEFVEVYTKHGYDPRNVQDSIIRFQGKVS